MNKKDCFSRGVGGNALFTPATFKPVAQRIAAHLEVLSLGAASTYEIFDGGTDSRSVENAEAEEQLRVLKAALGGWQDPKYAYAKTYGGEIDPTQVPYSQDQDLMTQLTSIKQWLSRPNPTPASNWEADWNSKHPQQKARYREIQNGIFRFGGGAASDLQSFALPSTFDPAGFRHIVVVFNSRDQAEANKFSGGSTEANVHGLTTSSGGALL